jgi:hypothetical protein
MTTELIVLTTALMAVCLVGTTRALLRELTGEVARVGCGPSPSARWYEATIGVCLGSLLLLAGTEVASWLAP